MSFSTAFKNVGHYFATGFKYVSIGVKDIVLFANKSQAFEPEVVAVVGALAGPQAVAISDLAFHTLGSVAAALSPVGDDADALLVAQQRLSAAGIQLDVQTIQDVKNAAKQIEAIFTALKTAKPTA